MGAREEARACSVLERTCRGRGEEALAIAGHVAEEIMHMADMERRDVSARDCFAKKGERG